MTTDGVSKDCGFRRPDAVWHHPLGRKKYKYLLEQPTSLTGAGRDVSFLCDAVVNQRKTAPLPPLTDRRSTGDRQNLSLISEEYHIVKNKGMHFLEFYEDAFTVQLHDEEHNLQVFPSLRPSGRLEAVKLMRMMDDMLEKASVDWQSDEMTDLSQLEGLLQQEKDEQSIYNCVFCEVIRQVSVGCAERGQLLSKIRQRYQSLLDRFLRRLRFLHTEAEAQQARNRRLTEEISRIETSMQQLRTKMPRIREFVSKQAENAHQEMAEALRQTQISIIQYYHELCELNRAHLEARLLQMTEDRDGWSQRSLSPALEMSEDASPDHTGGKVREVRNEPEAKPSQEGLTLHESPLVELIRFDGAITQKKLGQSRVHFSGSDEMVVSPLTKEAQKAFNNLSTVEMLQRELHDSEVRVKDAEQRALEAEEALQAALDKIQDLEGELQGRPHVGLNSDEEKEKTPPLFSSKPAPSKEPTLNPASSKKRTKKK
ncbi:axonemal dynein light chain domain-containing protein 1 [Xenentodon cancila]